MPSFDIVSQVDRQEVKNALEQANREIQNRYDFKGSDARIEQAAFESFHWHGETFSIPPGGTRLLSNTHCGNQAFALGKHLALQCHIEMTEDLVRAWCRDGRREIERSASSPGVQQPEEIARDLAQRIEQLHRVANRVYDRWADGLSRGN